ncbi:hypothetical protein BDP55DRAFT_430708 [Colletotrichum godetiae]|uniref:Uncharacterized protein n=1 Tax=Colletotrichum godetiae TaxID=1209918 RepID=A0AAJ0ARQ6_9PEZI|nr:uncharacterized protein BDP55DRAFT_430708 [Colletotrichum godetiae]KAK1689151.1 hypothetical protein BDP55DRAFT_430708 [Colletotrichum godetiae]
MDHESKEETHTSPRPKPSATLPTSNTSTSESCGHGPSSIGSFSSRTNDTTHTSTTSGYRLGCTSATLAAARGKSTAATQILSKDVAVAKSETRIGPVQQEFESDPSHKFWTWSQDAQNWYHVQGTDSVLWAPHQLD